MRTSPFSVIVALLLTFLVLGRSTPAGKQASENPTKSTTPAAATRADSTKPASAATQPAAAAKPASPATPATTAQPPETTKPAEAAKPTTPSPAALASFLPETATYLSLDGAQLTWKVSQEGDLIRVDESSTGASGVRTYWLAQSGSQLVQVKTGSGSTSVEQRRTWLDASLKPFQNAYDNADHHVTESATEEWVTDPTLGQLLHVRFARVDGLAKSVEDDYYQAGTGLIRRLVTDAGGKVLQRLELVPPPTAPPTATSHPEPVLALVDGSVLTAADEKPYTGQNLRLHLETVGVNAARSDWWQEAVGNHTESVTTEAVVLPSGEATLALVKRGAPAAAGPVTPTTEYWLMLLRDNPERKDMKTVYALVAEVTGDPTAARRELLGLSRGWQLPEATAQQ